MTCRECFVLSVNKRLEGKIKCDVSRTFQFVEKVFWNFKYKSFLVQQFFKNAGGFQRQSLWSLIAMSEIPCLSGATEGSTLVVYLRGRLLSLEQSWIASYLLSNAVIDKTAQWAVFQEGTLCKKKRPLTLSVLKFVCRFNRHDYHKWGFSTGWSPTEKSDFLT